MVKSLLSRHGKRGNAWALSFLLFSLDFSFHIIIYYFVMQGSVFFILRLWMMYENDNIAVQMRKWVLEYLILLIISRGEVYASDIIAHLKAYDLLIVEGTLYPLLSRLKKDQLLTYSRVESPSGPPRKYYQLTSHGQQVMQRMEQVRNQLSSAIAGMQNLSSNAE